MATKKPAPKAKTKAASPGVFDIAKPGSSQGFAASATSRPVIVTNRPVMQDPMVVVGGSDTGEGPQGPPPLSPAKKVVITPLHEDEIEAAAAETKPEPEPAAAEPEKTESPKENAPEPKAAALDEPTVPAEPAPKPEAEAESPAAEAAVPVLATDDEAAKRMREHMVHIEKLVEDEKYFLPIETVEERRSRKVAIFGLLLIIVLAIAWYDAALDASLLPNTYNLPHTSFFTVR